MRPTSERGEAFTTPPGVGLTKLGVGDHRRPDPFGDTNSGPDAPNKV